MTRVLVANHRWAQEWEMRVGDRVRLNVPTNARLHGSDATVVELKEWGALVRAPAAATGRFRATWDEMELIVEYVGECCSTCGSPRLRRSGTCNVCEDCGDTTGCG